MPSVRLQLLIALALLGGAAIAARTWMGLSRVEAPVAAEVGARARAALLEAGPAVERAYAAGDLRAVEQALRPAAAIPGAIEVAVVDRDGGVVAASRADLRGRAADATPLSPALRLATRRELGGVRMDVQEATLLAALRVRLERTPAKPSLAGPLVPAARAGFVLARFDLAAALNVARSALWQEATTAAALLLAALVAVALLLELVLARPARRIVHAIDRFDAGERHARAGPSGGEIGRIARAFDGMAERLQLREADLVETNRRLDLVLRCLPVGVMVVRRDDGRPVYVNPRWKELFGIPMDATRDILSLLSTVRCERADGSPFPLEQLPIATVLRTGRPADVRDLRVRRDDALVHLVAGAAPFNLWRDDVSFDAVVAVVEQLDAPLVPQRVPSSQAATLWAAPWREARPGVELTPASVEPFGPTVEALREARPVEAEVPDPETVLVVEGEAPLRELAERALGEAGYRVLVTGSAEEAMTFYRGEGREVRAVVLDLWVRGPGGDMLLDELLAFDPTARVVAASGYRPDMPELAASGKVVAFLPKPYSAERLLATVRKVGSRTLA